MGLGRESRRNCHIAKEPRTTKGSKKSPRMHPSAEPEWSVTAIARSRARERVSKKCLYPEGVTQDSPGLPAFCAGYPGFADNSVAQP